MLWQLRRVLTAGDWHYRGRLGSAGPRRLIARAGGPDQLTYDGHPLYTDIGDSAPGQARGNDLTLNGGVWHRVPVSGSAVRSRARRGGRGSRRRLMAPARTRRRNHPIT